MDPKAYVEMLRPVNCAMMGFAVIVGAVIGVGGLPSNYLDELAAGFLTAFFLTGASMVFNDYADREIDAVNAPYRPLPSGRVSVSAAYLYGWILTALGLASAAYTGARTLVLATISAASAIAYDFWGKKTGFPGNLMVSFNVAMPLIYGPLLVGRLEARVLVFWAMVFLANTAREIVKGIADVKGDSLHGVGTLAVRCGVRKAAIISLILISIAIALSPLPLAWGVVSGYYAGVVIVDIGLAYSALIVLEDPSRNTALRAKKLMLGFMGLGLVFFLLGTVF